MDHAAACGIILADTKFEFGLTDAGELLLIDEMMTPDSSRYWPADQYAPGGPQPSFDKQYVRDYLESIKWNKQPPVPSLPPEVVAPDAGQVPGRLPPPDRDRSGHRGLSWDSSTVREILDQLVAEMVDKGIRYDDAQREFEKRFITRVVQRATATSVAPPTRSACTATPSPARSRT